MSSLLAAAFNKRFSFSLCSHILNPISLKKFPCSQRHMCNILFCYLYMPPLFVYLFCRCSILNAQRVPMLTYLCLVFCFVINSLTKCPLANFCNVKYCIPSRKDKGNFTNIQLKYSFKLLLLSSDMFLANFLFKIGNIFLIYWVISEFTVVLVSRKNISKIQAPIHAFFKSRFIARNLIHITELYLQIIVTICGVRAVENH